MGSANIIKKIALSTIKDSLIYIQKAAFVKGAGCFYLEMKILFLFVWAIE
jgi:hypothetical protein